MDDAWKYNGDVEDIKRTPNNMVSTPAPNSDASQLASSSSSQREVAATEEDVTRQPSPTSPFSSLSQDQAATSKATLSSTSGLDLMSESGEGEISPQREVSRSQVSWGKFFIICGSDTYAFKSGNHISNVKPLGINLG